jgi:hypothetical protein
VEIFVPDWSFQVIPTSLSAGRVGLRLGVVEIAIVLLLTAEVMEEVPGGTTDTVIVDMASTEDVTSVLVGVIVDMASTVDVISLLVGNTDGARGKGSSYRKTGSVVSVMASVSVN